MTPTPSQRYLSTRGGSSNFSFEEVVLKGLAEDGGLFIPEQIPTLPHDWSSKWRNLSFEELAQEIFSLYISTSEIPSHDLQDIIARSYSTFRTKEVSPLIALDKRKQLYLLELFHGPTYAFKDVALQFLGNLFEYFLVRKNHNKTGKERNHLTVIGATSGDTGSAAIYGLRGKADLSIFMLHPKGKVSEVQEAQMTTILDKNVHNVSIEGSFDDCQDIVKALFADPQVSRSHRLAAVNSISWARILAQIVYYFHSYFSLVRSSDYDSSKNLRFVVPSGNFGDILAGWLVSLAHKIISKTGSLIPNGNRFAKRMGLPCSRLVIATNSNDILHRFMTSGTYSKEPVHNPSSHNGIPSDGSLAHSAGVQETLSPAMDILVSSNFERLLACLAFTHYSASPTPSTEEKLRIGHTHVGKWLSELKTTGSFKVDDAILKAAQEDFSSERIDDKETLSTISSAYSTFHPQVSSSEGTTGKTGGYILDPHSAIGIAASLRSVSKPQSGSPAAEYTISLATAHPAKFANAVDRALTGQEGYSFDDVLPQQFKDLKHLERRVVDVGGEDAFGRVRELICQRVPASGS